MGSLSSTSSAQLVQLILLEAARRKKDLKRGMFPSSMECVIHNLGTEQTRQVKRVSFCFLSVREDGRSSCRVFLTLFNHKSVPVQNMTRGRYV